MLLQGGDNFPVQGDPHGLLEGDGFLGAGYMGFVLVRRVCKNQGVLAVFMLEKIINAFGLAKPVDELQVCFIILNVIFTGTITAGQLQPVVDFHLDAFRTQRPLPQNISDDVGYVLVLKNTTVPTPGQQREGQKI
jgi:hypothetical protein